MTTPALTSLLNAYLFLKNVVFRAMYARWTSIRARSRSSKSCGRTATAASSAPRCPRILARIAREDPEGHALLSRALGRLRPRLVLNMVEDPAEAEKAEKLRASVRDYLGIEVSHLGMIFRDELQSVALGSRVPILRYKPACVLSRALYRIAEEAHFRSRR